MAASANARTSIPVFEPDDTQHRIRIGSWAVQVMQGKLNNTGSVTLTALATSTTVVDARAGINSFIGFTPLTSSGAVEIATMYLSTRGDGQFIITHSNSVIADRTFVYCVLG